MRKTITIIDTFGFLFRSFYALPPLTNAQGFPTGLLTGFLNFISQIERDHKTDYILFAIDTKGQSVRKTLDESYKANREEAPEELKKQLPIAMEWIEKMGFAMLGKEGYEADDIIATVAQLAKNAGMDVRIVSHDKDLYQLIDDGHIVVVDAIKRKVMNEAACIEKYGVTPKQFVDYQSLIGDTADNVPGVKGIGKVTAQKLLAQFETLDALYARIDEVTPPRIRELLVTYREDAYRSRELVRLHNSLFESVDFHTYDLPPEPLLGIVDDLFAYDMNAQIRQLRAQGKLDGHATSASVPTKSSPKLSQESTPLQQALHFEAITLDTAQKLFAVVDAIPMDTLIALDTETTGLERGDDTLVGYSFAIDETRGYYVPFAHSYLGVGEQVAIEDAKEGLRRILQRPIVGHNLKFDLGFIYDWLGIKHQYIYADTMLLAWLLDSSWRVGLDALAERFFAHPMIRFSATVKKGDTFASVDIADATRYAAEDAWMTYKLYLHLMSLLPTRGGERLLEVARSVEYPFVDTLIRMEHAGICVDVPFLQNLSIEFKHSLGALEQEIYALAGESFNINSPKQLGVILFEKLGLDTQKKNKTGYSTDEKVLDALVDAHSIVPKLLEYREQFKLYSTYIEPLIALGSAHPEHAIFTSFIQTGTATGRLSSKNPNLQNIPTKTAIGRQIRNAFVAREGKTFIGIDYSQIELRLLAHFSQDPVLVESFQKGLDIHTQTARTLFGEEAAQAKRAVAKTVNFGLLYGMGPKKLSETLGISTSEAKGIIERYFASFPTVKDFLSGIAEASESQGYVETLLGRRRWFDYATAAPMLRAGFKREAVNTVFQGSAADLIKMAMIAISKILEDKSDAVMLLQIHDELIFEVDSDKADAYAQHFRHIMEGIYTLRVPLECSVAIASRWGELK
ncbi:MAG: DNA polymerase I [Sulfuricurvum sp. PC08-66]|nr:MAG: DNA polymerase I [Sulfuricurvum sp. PC08-66]